MKIRLRLSGGFAGLVREASVDPSPADASGLALDPDTRHELDAAARRLLALLTAHGGPEQAPGAADHADATARQAGAQGTAPAGQGTSALRDAEYCEIELQDGDTSAHLAAPASSLSGDARSVLLRLRPLARPVRPD